MKYVLFSDMSHMPITINEACNCVDDTIVSHLDAMDEFWIHCSDRHNVTLTNKNCITLYNLCNFGFEPTIDFVADYVM